MYALGLLFGLGFDTASEISLLAMTAGAASGNLPIGAVLSLPILFAAGMSLMDTTDGVLMVKAYNWAFVNPLRKIFYNLTTTSLSIAVALVIGSIELLQVFIGVLGLKGPLYDYMGGLNLGAFGYVVVGIFLLVWGVSAAIWKFKRIEERQDRSAEPHAHEHTHSGGVTHVHQHFH
jgi:high-affinity nickel-transport protein